MERDVHYLEPSALGYDTRIYGLGPVSIEASRVRDS